MCSEGYRRKNKLRAKKNRKKGKQKGQKGATSKNKETIYDERFVYR
jgi:hypothetical protein